MSIALSAHPTDRPTPTEAARPVAWPLAAVAILGLSLALWGALAAGIAWLAG